KTPISSNDIEEKWKTNFGKGWSNGAGTPIIVGDYLYVTDSVNKTLNRISPETGETLKSVPCDKEYQFFTTIAYFDGMIFVPKSIKAGKKSVAIVTAYDEESMDKIWDTEPIGDIDAQLQPLSAISCHNGYIYISVSNGKANLGAFACFDVIDYDKTKSDETKSPTWVYTPDEGLKSGYYWSGGAVVNNAIVFGGEATELVSHSLNSSDVYDKIVLEQNPATGIRSTAVYDPDTNRIFVTSKSGYMHSIKMNGDNTFDKNSLISVKLGNDITSSPVVFKGRVYVGGGGISSTSGFTVLNADTLDIIYQINDIKSQSSPIITTAYATEENGWQIYAYVTKYAGYENGIYTDYAPNSSCIYCISDKQGQTTGEFSDIITPSKRNYCTQSLTIDKNGNMYYYNDTAYMFAFGHKDASKAEYTAIDIENQINLMKSKSTIMSRDFEQLKRVMTRYDVLSKSEQKKVVNLPDLTDMIKKSEALSDELTVVSDLNFALKNLDVNSITLIDDEKITQLSVNYHSLSEASKKLVTNADRLFAAIVKIQGFKDADMIAGIMKSIKNLPSLSEICLDDKDMVLNVEHTLSNQNEIVKNGVDATKLNALIARINEIEEAVISINNRIFNNIDPMNVTLGDKATIDDLIEACKKVSEKDKKHIKNYDDVLFAKKVIEQLQNGIIPKEVFENIFGSDKSYSYEGKTAEGNSYTIVFDGKNITDPTIDFNATISFGSKNSDDIKNIASDAVILSFTYEGLLPGKAMMTIDVDLEDGTYSLFYFNEKTKKSEFLQEIKVSNGKTSFEINHCSDYFISAAKNPSTGEKQPVAVYIIIACCVIIIAGFFVFQRFKKNK
ncbi:MAG: hypothetical protein RR177_02095, partial [Oscillospiraceae bacterium]